MKDCDCEKKHVDDTWLDKNDYGDEFLREESFKIINRILRDKKYHDINHDSVFNIKVEQDEINEMSLEDVNIDYSYLENKKFRGLENDTDEVKEIDLIEDTGDFSDSTDSEIEEPEKEEPEYDSLPEKLDKVLEEEKIRYTERGKTDGIDTDEQEELLEISKIAPEKVRETSVTEDQIDKVLEEDFE